MIFTIMNRGGAETMIMNYFRHIDRTKIMFDFVVHRSEKGYYDDEIKKLGGKIYVFPPVHPLYFYEYKKKIDEFLDSHNEYRIIHSHTQELAYFFYKAAYKRGVPYIITHSHNASMLFDIKAPLRIIWRKVMFKYINIYFTCGKEAAVHYYGKERASQTILMENAINVEKFKFNSIARKKIRKELNIKENEFVIGHIGRFTPQKNHTLLVDIFKAFLSKHKSAKLVLVGDGERKEDIEDKIKKLKITDSVIFTGLRQDIPDILSAFDCLLMPSLFEGVSVAMIEAQASGLPIITSTNVPSEVGILDSTLFIPLKTDINVWVSTIERYMKKSRYVESYQLVSNAGYDIKNNAIKLQNYYLSLK